MKYRLEVIVIKSWIILCSVKKSHSPFLDRLLETTSQICVFQSKVTHVMQLIANHANGYTVSCDLHC